MGGGSVWKKHSSPAAKADGEDTTVIAAVSRCATQRQNQIQKP
jgi:hypothetical protein